MPSEVNLESLFEQKLTEFFASQDVMARIMNRPEVFETAALAIRQELEKTIRIFYCNHCANTTYHIKVSPSPEDLYWRCLKCLTSEYRNAP